MTNRIKNIKMIILGFFILITPILFIAQSELNLKNKELLEITIHSRDSLISSNLSKDYIITLLNSQSTNNCKCDTLNLNKNSKQFYCIKELFERDIIKKLSSSNDSLKHIIKVICEKKSDSLGLNNYLKRICPDDEVIIQFEDIIKYNNSKKNDTTIK